MKTVGITAKMIKTISSVKREDLLSTEILSKVLSIFKRKVENLAKQEIKSCDVKVRHYEPGSSSSSAQSICPETEFCNSKIRINNC